MKELDPLTYEDPLHPLVEMKNDISNALNDAKNMSDKDDELLDQTSDLMEELEELKRKYYDLPTAKDITKAREKMFNIQEKIDANFKILLHL